MMSVHLCSFQRMDSDSRKFDKIINMIGIDRAARKTLVSQLETALRQAILRGEYGLGDCLPGFRELSRTCKVSEKVSRQALARLARDGWISQRRGVGSIVLERSDQVGRGLILFVDGDFGVSLFANRMKWAMRCVLEDRGFRLVEVRAYDGRGRLCADRLSETLRHRAEIVVEYGYHSEIRRVIEESGLPFVTLGNGGPARRSDAPTCIGCIEMYTGRGLSGFVLACVRKRIKTVWQFIYGGGAYDVTEWLKSCGIAVQTFSVPLSQSSETMRQESYELMTKLLRSRKLPDLLLLTDDGIAQVALFALAERQVRVPEDVRVVSHVNKGLRWLWPRQLARLELDPQDCGRSIARAVCGHLRTGRAIDIQIGTVWREGESF